VVLGGDEEGEVDAFVCGHGSYFSDLWRCRTLEYGASAPQE
jgi:hypothetical protein